MQVQWTASIPVFITLSGDEDVMVAKKKVILEKMGEIIKRQLFAETGLADLETQIMSSLSWLDVKVFINEVDVVDGTIECETGIG